MHEMISGEGASGKRVPRARTRDDREPLDKRVPRPRPSQSCRVPITKHFYITMAE